VTTSQRAAIRDQAVDTTASREAVDAWRQLHVSPREPVAIVTLKEARRKSAVYRLLSAGPRGEDVVAKRSATLTARVEHAVYRDVLARLPVSRLECYGIVDDRAPGRSWLFVEYAGGQPFRGGDEAHRALAARWLAAVHSGTDDTMLQGLPDRGLTYYLDVLHDAMRALAGAADNRDLSAADAATAARSLRACDIIAERWDDLATICGSLPATLVHGDFGRKNVRVRGGGRGGIELLLFDWEVSGRGAPVVDLARLDTDTYAQTMARSGRRLRPKVARDLVEAGRLLWCVSSIPGEASHLAAPWAVRAMPKVRAYADEMDEALEALRWR
jgi:hypothetical protein